MWTSSVLDLRDRRHGCNRVASRHAPHARVTVVFTGASNWWNGHRIRHRQAARSCCRSTWRSTTGHWPTSWSPGREPRHHVNRGCPQRIYVTPSVSYDGRTRRRSPRTGRRRLHRQRHRRAILRGSTNPRSAGRHNAVASSDAERSARNCHPGGRTGSSTHSTPFRWLDAARSTRGSRKPTMPWRLIDARSHVSRPHDATVGDGPNCQQEFFFAGPQPGLRHLTTVPLRRPSARERRTLIILAVGTPDSASRMPVCEMAAGRPADLPLESMAWRGSPVIVSAVPALDRPASRATSAASSCPRSDIDALAQASGALAADPAFHRERTRDGQGSVEVGPWRQPVLGRHLGTSQSRRSRRRHHHRLTTEVPMLAPGTAHAYRPSRNQRSIRRPNTPPSSSGCRTPPAPPSTNCVVVRATNSATSSSSHPNVAGWRRNFGGRLRTITAAAPPSPAWVHGGGFVGPTPRSKGGIGSDGVDLRRVRARLPRSPTEDPCLRQTWPLRPGPPPDAATLLSPDRHGEATMRVAWLCGSSNRVEPGKDLDRQLDVNRARCVPSPDRQRTRTSSQLEPSSNRRAASTTSVTTDAESVGF